MPLVIPSAEAPQDRPELIGGLPALPGAQPLTGEDTLKQPGYTPTKKMAQGDFMDEILKAVAVERYDLLVLGAYGHQRPKYLKMISDEALNLVRLSTRPVFVYRDQTEM
jgi:nucleotide-binding universal stress UspA family protein